jgi:hypothetical protein
LNIFITEIVLASFGIAAEFGGRLAPKVKAMLGNSYLIVSGGIGFIGLNLFAFSSSLTFNYIGIIFVWSFLYFYAINIGYHCTINACSNERYSNVHDYLLVR